MMEPTFGWSNRVDTTNPIAITFRINHTLFQSVDVEPKEYEEDAVRLTVDFWE